MSEKPRKLSSTEKHDERLKNARAVEKLRYDLEKRGLSPSEALVAARHTVKSRNTTSSSMPEQEKPEQERDNGDNDQSGGTA
ncbi:hypothetical protein FOH24_13900 [Acetobacter tropicalis]|uniref:Uncharacterized protein n=1 Tax=Acetobacter tropicalis TaxID=104102 RepID=A0A095AW54_9PROT|nr:hypothetical protein [Acetobacter tropicalis]KAA8387360.1 hypothetical protein FOH24_13900 [Acetobacter tropicalis]KAA8387527.1 hypothetical protein FOH22_09395 [Acetobacter tropicalis]KGB21008.1 hypothetical protein AtDm6_3373 [Acetobacter tropicalis]MBC9010097.1 hypothetical protein [Acetobacter tropicalis]MDO8170967.1 hypothetical protein [Acetobacter tropicalis]